MCLEYATVPVGQPRAIRCEKDAIPLPGSRTQYRPQAELAPSEREAPAIAKGSPTWHDLTVALSFQGLVGANRAFKGPELALTQERF